MLQIALEPRTPTATRNGTILLLALCGMLFFLFLGEKPFSTRGEPREALVAQSMLANHDLIIGSGYGGVVPSKPPFMHWVILGASQLQGAVTEFSARLPSALFSTLFVLLFFRFLTPRYGISRAFLSSVILLSSIEWLRASTTTRVDMTLAALLGIGVLCAYRWFEERQGCGVPYGAILAFTAATLTKGPVAMLLPGAIFGLFLLSSRVPFWRAVALSLRLFVPVLALAALWYWAAYQVRGQPFLDRVYYENIARFSGTQEDEPHKHSVGYLYGTIFLGLLPWTLFLFPTLVLSAKRFSLNSSWRAEQLRGVYARLQQDSFVRLAVILVFAFILFFSIPEGKRSVYLLPIYPFLAFWLSGWRVFSAPTERELRWIKGSVRVLCGVLLLVVLVGGLTALAPGFVQSQLAAVTVRRIDWHFLLSTLAPVYGGALLPTVAASGLVLILLFGIVRSVRSSLELGIGVVLVAAMLQGSYLTTSGSALSGLPLARELEQLSPPAAELFSFQDEFYGVSFYLGRPIRSFGSGVAMPEESLVLLERRHEAELAALLPANQQLEFVTAAPNAIDRVGQYVSVFRVIGRATP